MLKFNSNLVAILGPTNTGKTFLAFDRLTSYQSGIFGFPLRLLARENFDKAVARLGSEKVALITGEEKILPRNPKYFFCTVESMPLNIEVECVAIDEVQMAGDFERGHIFTDRILNLRGAYETIFLGSMTIEKILVNLFPKISIEKRTRFSKLSFLNKKTLSKLEPRSAIIAFNINSVYEIAESLRSYKGGAAIVLGSLSPRTRNAQVEVYEDKKVDFLVATDAIGMGLNLNINHVSFSSLQKYDGRSNRNLTTAELGQIAGRAGRHFNDGTFGYLKNVGNVDPLITGSIEDHNFENINRIYWRNSNIDFSSIQSVRDSLKQFPVKNFFIHKKNAIDEVNFCYLSEDINIKKYLVNSQEIRLLWDICSIPDFQKIFNDTYLELLKNIFLTLIKNNGILDENWLQDKIFRLEDYSGGIDELSIKIAKIRTWTYIANQTKWITNFQFWQEKTRKIENILSDRLHESLTGRFVDFSASYFVDVKKRGEEVSFEVDDNKSIKINGQNYGYIDGFNLQLNVPNSESLFSLTHVKKSFRTMIEEKFNNFLKAPMASLNYGNIKDLIINQDIKIYWGDEAIGKLVKGKNIFSPKAEVFNTEFLDSDKKLLINKKLQEWLDSIISIHLKPLTSSIDETISSEVRAIIYNVYNNLGTMEIGEHYKTIKNLNEHDKSSISKSGVRIGAKFFFMPNLLKKLPMEINALLWKVFNDSLMDTPFPLPSDGRVSFVCNELMPNSYWFAIGYKNLDKFIIRIDVFERIFYIARKKIKYGPFLESSDMMNPAGCNSDQLGKVLSYCGFEYFNLGDCKKLFYSELPKKDKIKKTTIKIDKRNVKVVNLKIHKNKKNARSTMKIKIKPIKKEVIMPVKKEDKPDPNSPFAVLQKLL